MQTSTDFGKMKYKSYFKFRTKIKIESKASPRVTPSRDERYMALAFIYSFFSKDPKTQVGSQIVGKNNVPLGAGYNGPPRGVDDNEINWERPFKYKYINHSEINAILHSKRSKLKGSTIYVTAKPCPNCMLDIVTNRIKRVVYYSGMELFDANSTCKNKDLNDESDDIAKKCGVKLEPFRGNLHWILERIKFMEERGVFDHCL